MIESFGGAQGFGDIGPGDFVDDGLGNSAIASAGRTFLVQARWDVSHELVDDAANAEALISNLSTRIVSFSDGQPVRGALSVWWSLGQPDSEYPMQELMRLDMSPTADRAALRWLSDGTLAAMAGAAPLEHPLTVLVNSSREEGYEAVPGVLWRLDMATAVRALREFVSTGQRPTCVDWEKAPN
jgi:Immunity protein Imm1